MICVRESYKEKEENREGNVRRFVFRKTKIPHEFPPVHLSEYRSVLKGKGDGATDGLIIRESAFIKAERVLVSRKSRLPSFPDSIIFYAIDRCSTLLLFMDVVVVGVSVGVV